MTSSTTCPFTIATAPTLTCPASQLRRSRRGVEQPGHDGQRRNFALHLLGGGTLPGGLTLNTTTGAITGTPTASGTFTIQVKDAKVWRLSTACPFTIKGGPVLTCPVVTPARSAWR